MNLLRALSIEGTVIDRLPPRLLRVDAKQPATGHLALPFMLHPLIFLSISLHILSFAFLSLNFPSVLDFPSFLSFPFSSHPLFSFHFISPSFHLHCPQFSSPTLSSVHFPSLMSRHLHSFLFISKQFSSFPFISSFILHPQLSR